VCKRTIEKDELRFGERSVGWHHPVCAARNDLDGFRAVFVRERAALDPDLRARVALALPPELGPAGAERALERAVGATDAADALRHALDAWRCVSAPRLADVIDRLSMEANANERFDALGGLTAKQLEATIDEHLAQPRDPRWVSAMVPFFSSPPNRSRAEYWWAVLAMLQHTRDVRALDAIERVKSRGAFGRSAVGERISAAVVAVRFRLREQHRGGPPRLSPAGRELLVRLERAW
jgi:hypothetical protein